MIPAAVILQSLFTAVMLPGTLGGVVAIPASLVLNDVFPKGETAKIDSFAPGRYSILTASLKLKRIDMEFQWRPGAPSSGVFACVRNTADSPLVLEMLPVPSLDRTRAVGMTLAPADRTEASYQCVPWTPRPGDVGIKTRMESAPPESAAGKPAGLSIAEISLLDSEGLSRLQSPGWRMRLAAGVPGTVFLLILTALCFLLFLAGTCRRAGLWLAVSALSIALLTASVALRVIYSPVDGYDYRLSYETSYRKSSNLSYGLILGSRMLQGHGMLLPDGKPDTYRMPGYPLFVALSNLLSRGNTDLSELSAATVRSQVLFRALSLAFFAYGASRILPAWLAAFLSFLVAWWPSQLDYTQVDSVMLACGLFITGSLCLVLKRERTGPSPGILLYVLLHASFALFFALRSDVLPGWIAVSLAVHWRKKQVLLLPLACFLLIGVSWGLYKQAHDSRFVMTTSNFAHVAFVGLWQVPYHRFAWEPSDSSYDQWISSHGYKYMDPATTDFATPEVARFWCTYPGYTLSMVGHKAVKVISYCLWTGTMGGIPFLAAHLEQVHWSLWTLVLLILAALLTGHERRRTALLAWPIFLNLPIFLLLQESGGRFIYYPAASIALAGLPLVFERAFWISLWQRRAISSALLLFGMLFWAYRQEVDHFLMSWDWFRYWAPLLDPAKCTLNVLK